MMDNTDLGTLEIRGDDAVVTFTRRLAHPMEKVWRALTEPEHLATWFPDGIEGELRAGASVRFGTAGGDGFDGEVLAFEPPKLLELRWGTDNLRLELAADGDGTVLTLVDTFAEIGKAARDAAGWHECLVHLVAEIDGTEPPAWSTVWVDVHPQYLAAYPLEAGTIGPPEGYEPPGS